MWGLYKDGERVSTALETQGDAWRYAMYHGAVFYFHEIACLSRGYKIKEIIEESGEVIEWEELRTRSA